MIKGHIAIWQCCDCGAYGYRLPGSFWIPSKVIPIMRGCHCKAEMVGRGIIPAGALVVIEDKPLVENTSPCKLTDSSLLDTV